MKFIGKKSVSSMLSKVFGILNVFMWITIPIFFLYFLAIRKSSFPLPMVFDALQLEVNGSYFSTISLVLLTIGLVISNIIIYKLHLIFENISQNKIFNYDNVKHIKLIGILSITGAVIYSIVGYLIGKEVYKLIKVVNGKLSVSFSLDYIDVIVGIIIIVIAEVLKEAIKLKEENELTV